MGYGKKNTIKIDPLSYNIGLIGERCARNL